VANVTTLVARTTGQHHLEYLPHCQFQGPMSNVRCLPRPGAERGAPPLLPNRIQSQDEQRFPWYKCRAPRDRTPGPKIVVLSQTHNRQSGMEGKRRRSVGEENVRASRFSLTLRTLQTVNQICRSRFCQQILRTLEKSGKSRKNKHVHDSPPQKKKKRPSEKWDAMKIKTEAHNDKLTNSTTLKHTSKHSMKNQ